MDVNLRKLITSHRMHQLRADVERLYVKRENGGRGLIQLELIYKTTTIGLKENLDTTTDWMRQLVKKNTREAKEMIFS